MRTITETGCALQAVRKVKQNFLHVVGKHDTVTIPITKLQAREILMSEVGIEVRVNDSGTRAYLDQQI